MFYLYGSKLKVVMKANILLVDDQSAIREILTLILESELDANIVSCTCVQEATDFIAANAEVHFSAIISDYRMPNGSALDLYEATKNLNIPFIILTGIYLDGEEEVAEFIKKEQNKILYKPLNEVELIAEIAALI